MNQIPGEWSTMDQPMNTSVGHVDARTHEASSPSDVLTPLLSRVVVFRRNLVNAVAVAAAIAAATGRPMFPRTTPASRRTVIPGQGRLGREGSTQQERSETLDFFKDRHLEVLESFKFIPNPALEVLLCLGFLLRLDFLRLRRSLGEDAHEAWARSRTKLSKPFALLSSSGRCHSKPPHLGSHPGELLVESTISSFRQRVGSLISFLVAPEEINVLDHVAEADLEEGQPQAGERARGCQRPTRRSAASLVPRRSAAIPPGF
jgi:hypothetical protein